MQLVAPASLAKLMTAEVVFNEIKEGNLTLEDEFVVSTNAWRKGGAPSERSTMFAAIHSRVKVADLIKGVIIHSGNDACIVLAEGIAGNENDFARLMNGRAHELGLSKSNFTNPHGMPDPQMRVTTRENLPSSRSTSSDLPGFLQDLRGEGVHLEQDPPVQSQPAACLEHWRRRDEDRLHRGSGIRPRRLGHAERPAADRRRYPDEVGQGARRRGEETAGMGLQGLRGAALFAEGQSIGEAKVYGGAQGRVPLVAKGVTRLMVPRAAATRSSPAWSIPGRCRRR